MSRQALRLAGIGGPRQFGSRSAIVCDERGNPTGHLLEWGAIRLVHAVIPAEPFAGRRDRLAALLHDMATAGLTGAHVMDLDQDALTLYDALDADGQLPLHEPDCHGQSTAAYWKDPGDYTEAVRVLAQAGVQIATHAIGGAAVQHVLDTLAQVTPTGSTVRHRIEHIETPPRTRCRASPSSVSSPPCSPATPPSTPSPITATTGPGASMTSGPTGPGAAATSSTPAPSSLWAQTGQSHPMTPGTSGVGCSCPFSTCVGSALGDSGEPGKRVPRYVREFSLGAQVPAGVGQLAGELGHDGSTGSVAIGVGYAQRHRAGGRKGAHLPGGWVSRSAMTHSAAGWLPMPKWLA